MLKSQNALLDMAKSQPRQFWRLYKKRSKGCSVIELEEWHTYYFSQLLCDTSDVHPISKPTTSQHQSPSFPELSNPISVGEVESALKRLRASSAPGPDGITPSVVLLAADTVMGPLTALFNLVFDSDFPADWSSANVIPLFNQGDPRQYYRGISIGNILGKLYASILNQRISNWAEREGKRAKGQGGFRPDHRTIEQLLTLQVLIDKSAAKKTPLFTCFVDFRKASDTVPRAQLWSRLESLGLDGKILASIESMFSNVSAAVLTQDGRSAPFPCTMGVKQGCPLSPTLFGLVIDELEEWLLH